MALALPGLSIDQFIEKVFCSSVQKIGRSFSFLVERSTSIRQPSVSEYSLSFTDRMDADHRSVNECSFMDPGLTIGHFLNTIQTLDIFCRSRRQFCRAVTYWFYWRFLNLSFSLDIFCLCNFYAKISQKIFCPKSSMISICYRFFILVQVLAQGMQCIMANMNKTSDLSETRLATDNRPRSMFNEAQIDIRFHTPRNLWKRPAWRRKSETGE